MIGITLEGILCGGLVVKMLNFLIEVGGSNFTNDMHYGQHWNVDHIFHVHLNYLG
jgi:hypothetical protein